MGWLELPVSCPHCGESQSIRPRFTCGGLIKSLVEFMLTVLMGALFGDAPDSMWSGRRFCCKFCGKDFEATPDARNWKRPPVTHCRSCGYNLTGNTSGTCPECGGRKP